MRRLLAVGMFASTSILGNTGTVPKHEAPIVRYHEFSMSVMQQISISAQQTFECIAYAESRDNPVDVNHTTYAGGEYQFEPYIWQYGAKHFGFTAKYAQDAPLWQQQEVAIFYYNRNNGFYEWEGDGCV